MRRKGYKHDKSKRDKSFEEYTKIWKKWKDKLDGVTINQTYFQFGPLSDAVLENLYRKEKRQKSQKHSST